MLYIFLTSCSVGLALLFTDTHSQFSEYGKRQNYAGKRLRQLAMGPFWLKRWWGRAAFPKFTLWQHEKILWENNVALSVVSMCVCVCHWCRLSWQTKGRLANCSSELKSHYGESRRFSFSMYGTANSQMIKSARSSTKACWNFPEIKLILDANARSLIQPTITGVKAVIEVRVIKMQMTVYKIQVILIHSRTESMT